MEAKELNLLKNFSFKKLLFNKKFSVALSVFVAFIFWLMIIVKENPDMERTFSKVEFNVITDSTVLNDDHLELVGENSYKATIKVNGPNYIVSRLKSDDFRIIPDLSLVNDAGVFQVKLTVAKKNNDVAYNIIDIEPSTITVKFDYYSEKIFDVIPVVEGYEKDLELIYQPIIKDPDLSTIRIRGPRSEVDKIYRVEAYHETEGKISSTTSFENCDIRLFDSSGQILDNSPFTFKHKTEESVIENIGIKLEVTKTKTFNYIPTYTGNLNAATIEALNNLLINNNSNRFTLQGPPDTIKNLENVECKPIDVTKISPGEDNTIKVTPILPDGVRTTNGGDTFTVSFDPEVLHTKTLNIKNVRTIGSLPDGLVAKLATDNVQVYVCSTKKIQQLSLSDLYVEVDLSSLSFGSDTQDGYAKGTYMINGYIKTNKSDDVIWQIEPINVEYTIK